MFRPLVPSRRGSRLSRPVVGALLAAVSLGLAAAPAAATPTAGAWLVFDARSGEVVARHNADQAWYPASVTKLMTTWVTLQAIRAGRITPTSLVPMTPLATKQAPSKMGFKVGEVVTVDNALKIIMVKSANDVSMALAEFVGGSKEGFVAEMNRQAQLLGMRSTRWNNPHGLPDTTQVTTARDLGILARALLREFPEAESLWRLPGIQIGEEVIRNHNHLIDHFPGADGMKTGFICSAGFNVVASASRGDRRLVAVVLGARSARQRAEIAAELFTRGFENAGGGALFGRFTVPETLDRMSRGPEAGQPVRDVKQDICGPKRKDAPDPELFAEPTRTGPRDDPGAVIRPDAQAAAPVRTSWLSQRFEAGPPVRVWVGGPEAAPADAGSVLALAADPSIAVVPLFAAAPGAIRPQPATQTAGLPNPGAIARSMPLPATGPASGTGLGATLAPADGRPMAIAPGMSAPGAAALAARPPQKATAAGPGAAKAAAKPAPKPVAVAAKPAPKPARPEPAKAKKPKHVD